MLPPPALLRRIQRQEAELTSVLGDCWDHAMVVSRAYEQALSPIEC